jgi:hypothetical protein
LAFAATPAPTTSLPAIFDTGSTTNFETFDGKYSNIRELVTPYPIMCPNGTMMHATHEAELDFPALPIAARLVRLVPNLTSGTLVSFGQLCDNGCQALFDKHSVTTFYDNRPVLYGTRPGLRSLWTLTPSTMSSLPPTLAAANVLCPAFLPSSTLAADIVAFMHAALGSPVLSTLQKALDSGFLPGFPGLTSRSLRNNPPFSVATVKGHDGETYTNTSDLTTFKIAINAVLSTPNCLTCAIDLSDFYLMTRLKHPEYMRIHSSLLPQEIIDHYQLDVLIAPDGYFYVRINGGMYGLKQARRIANEAIVQRLATHDFIQCRHTPGLFRHKFRPIFFTLIIDDFFVVYTCQEDADFLISCLRLHYDTKVDWTASLYSGITMAWD